MLFLSPGAGKLDPYRRGEGHSLPASGSSTPALDGGCEIQEPDAVVGLALRHQSPLTGAGCEFPILSGPSWAWFHP